MRPDTNLFNTCFWIDRSGDYHLVAGHWQKSQFLYPDLARSDANEKLLQDGWLRCVMTDSDLFYERRGVPNRRQLKQLRDTAIENRVRVTIDNENLVGKR